MQFKESSTLELKQIIVQDIKKEVIAPWESLDFFIFYKEIVGVLRYANCPIL